MIRDGYLDEKEYQKLLNKAKWLLRGHDTIDPFDIVNNAVLMAIESAELVYPHELMKMAINEAIAGVHNQPHVLKNGRDPKKRGSQHYINTTKYSKSSRFAICTKCNEEKPINDFYFTERRVGKSNSATCKLNEILYYCKDCHMAYMRDRYDANRDRIIRENSERNKKYRETKKYIEELERRKKYYRDNPEARERQRQRCREYHQKIKDKKNNNPL